MVQCSRRHRRRPHRRRVSVQCRLANRRSYFIPNSEFKTQDDTVHGKSLTAALSKPIHSGNCTGVPYRSSYASDLRQI